MASAEETPTFGIDIWPSGLTAFQNKLTPTEFNPLLPRTTHSGLVYA